MNPRFPLFDSLRAIAALSIFAYHVAFVLDGFDGLAISPWLTQLNVGVPIFFVISGFLLYRPFARARMLGERSPALRAYAVRRFLRIVPAYWVALPLIVVWTGQAAEVFTPTGVLSYFGFAQMYDPDTFTGGIGQAWTLDVEVLFYASLPLWALLLARGASRLSSGSWVRDELFALGGLFTVGVAWKLWFAERSLAAGDGDAFVLLTVLPAWFDTFAVGMGIAVLSVWAAEGGGQARAVSAVAAHPGACWLVAAAGFLLLGVLELPERSSVIVDHELKALIAAAIVLPAVFGDPARSVVRRILAFPPLLWIGLVSYAFYLWHLAALEEVEQALGADIGGAGVTLVALGLTLVISALSWYGLERPFLRLGRSLTGPTEQTRTLADDERAISDAAR